jgi:outer membrane protein with beta-barrel domain
VRPVVAAVAIAVTSFALPVGAVEREQHAGLDAGLSMLVMKDKTDVGGALGGHWAYGLSDQFNLMAEATWSLVALGERVQDVHTPRTRPTNVVNLGVGMAYVFDVLQWVPYAGLLLGGDALFGGTISGTTILPAATVAIGLDYRFKREWAAGIAFRQHFFTDMDTYPSFTHVFARLEYNWGW